jgi:CNT family concentrative nucleoside transporter
LRVVVVVVLRGCAACCILQGEKNLLDIKVASHSKKQLPLGTLLPSAPIFCLRKHPNHSHDMPCIVLLSSIAFLVVSIVLNKGGPISVLAVAYGFTTLYLISAYSPAGTFARPAKATWNAGASGVGKLPLRIRQAIGYGIFPIAMILTAVIPEDDANGTRVQRVISLCGLLLFVLGLYATSRNRSAIHWPTVATGIGLQYLLGLFVIRTDFGRTIFSYIGRFMATFLGFSSAGIGFIIGGDMMKAYGMTFLFGVLPAIIFFGAVIQVMYYYNIIQTAIGAMGRVIVYFFEISGVEVIAACAAPFVGMSESAMLVGPYLEHATNAEIHQVLASGFATISGSVYLGLIGFGASPTHLITCCVMSVPCAIVTSKMRYPEEEVPLTRGKNVALERPEAEDSFVHALANGSILGMQLCIVISAVLVGFISLLACANYVLDWLFVFLGVTGITIERLIGYCFYPIAWILGMPSQDVYAASKMMGVKYIINEFVGFAQAKDAGFFSATGATERGKMLATFACCSFANPSSLGSQISLLGKMAPSRASDIARVAVSAIIAGALSTIMSACIAGIVL